MTTSKKNVRKAAKRSSANTTEKVEKETVKKLVQPKTEIKHIKALVMQAEAEKTTLDTVYIVDDSNIQITLEVNVGAEGQTSDMTIMLDKRVVVQNLAGDFSETPLGTNNQLNGEKLSIVANIADTSRDTNLTNLTIHLKGGVSPNNFPLCKTVNEQGDSEDYLCLIEFFNPLL
ncbi:MAG: hypothetical protein ABI237_01300 [Ginsengibacter sp.]